MELDSQKRAEELNSSLPINLSAADAHNNPCLVSLLSSLTNYISPDGRSKSVQKDITETWESVKKAKMKWLQNSILYTELNDLILDNELRATDKSFTGSQFYKAAQEILNYAEAAGYIDTSSDPATGVTLLGLSQKDLDKANPHRQHVQSIQQKLIPEVEQRLRRCCESLVDFHELNTKDATAGEGSRLNFAKVSQLPALLEEQIARLDLKKSDLKKMHRVKEKQLDVYRKTISKCLSMLEDIIMRHQLRAQAEFDRVTCDWLAANCDTMCLKIRLLELQLLCDTYHEDTIKALKIIRKNLDTAIKSAEHELQTLNSVEQSYKVIGPQFEAVVAEYVRICDDIDNKKWALRELRTSMD